MALAFQQQWAGIKRVAVKHVEMGKEFIYGEHVFIRCTKKKPESR